MHALVSKNCFVPEGFHSACVLVQGGVIVDVVAALPPGFSGHVRDVGELMILPGLLDTHVHVNEPGRTDWEGFATATRAAAAGGITTIVDMPLNCRPVTTTKDNFNKKLDAAKGKTLVDVGFWGGVVPASVGDLEELLQAGVLGVKSFLIDSGISDFPPMRKQDLEQAMKILATYQLPYLIHAEIDDGKTCFPVTKKYNSFLNSRPRAWENEAVSLMIELCEKYETPVHIVHLSSAEALGPIREAKAHGIKITVETCPHYLMIASEDIGDGQTLFKCCPPIREEENRLKLWQGLKEGLIDFIVSDHSPCTVGLKLMAEEDLAHAWGGIASLELNLPLVWTEARRQGIGLEQLVPKLTENPAHFLGLKNKGRIAKACQADLVVFDAKSHYKLTKEHLQFKNKFSPYVGSELWGEVVATYLAGELIYEGGRFMGGPRGRLLLR